MPPTRQRAMNTPAVEQDLIEKLRALPPHRRAEVEDFIDFLSSKDQERGLLAAAAKLSEPSFAAEWDNAEDAAYDQL
jgi:hypothetical protein